MRAKFAGATDSSLERGLPLLTRIPPVTVGDTVTLYRGRIEQVVRLLCVIDEAGADPWWVLIFTDGRSARWEEVTEIRAAPDTPHQAQRRGRRKAKESNGHYALAAPPAQANGGAKG